MQGALFCYTDDQLIPFSKKQSAKLVYTYYESRPDVQDYYVSNKIMLSAS